MSDERVLATLRHMAWQRAKAEMRAALDTFWDEEEPFNLAKQAVDRFIKDSEDSGIFD